MATPTRVATKTKWALDDIEEAAITAKAAAAEIEKVICQRGDTQNLTYVLALVKALAEIERKALMARRGEYRK